MNEAIQRRDAAQAAFDRFNGKPFAWGRNDCVRLAAFVLREMKRPVSLVKGGEYHSARGALRALARAGFPSLDAAVDAQGLMRIPPAAALQADLIGLPAEDGDWIALAVALGNGRILGFAGGVGQVGQPRPEVLRTAFAWRV